MTLEQLRVLITADASSFNKSMKSVRNSLSSLDAAVGKSSAGITNSLNGIAKKISFAAITAGIIGIGKSALNAASNLQEVQNVVDTSFGSMSGEVDEFAKNAISQFGLSESAAKGYASTLMAMGNSMGIAKENAKTMSIQLTGLAADLASFYNTDVETAFNALQGVYTNNTRALRQYGVVITDAALSAFALQEGITKNVSAMSQAEKATLAYNYVLSVTKDAQNDFAKTHFSWANSLKTITNQIQTLMGIIGTMMMTALQPLLNLLSTIIGYAIQAAQALAAMFGVELTFSSSGGGGGLADQWEDVEDATNGATGAAKKYKKLIEGFDELNILSATGGSSSGSGASGGGGAGYDVGSYFDITKSDMELFDFNKWIEEVDKWFVQTRDKFEELGVLIGQKINGFFNYVNWERLGNTFADGFNDIFALINNAFDETDFVNIGAKIATLLNGVMDRIDPKLWGQMLVNKINAAFETLFGFVTNFSWKKLGDDIVIGIRTALEKLNVDAIAGSISGLINGLTQIIAEWADSFPIQEIANKIWTIIDNVLKGVDWKSLGESLNKLITKLFKAIQNIDYSEITGAISQLLDGLDIVGLWVEYMKTKAGLIFEGLKGILTTPEGWKLVGIAVAGSIGSMLSTALGKGIALLETFFTATLLKIFFTKGLSGVITYLGRCLELVKGFLSMVGAEVKYGFAGIKLFLSSTAGGITTIFAGVIIAGKNFLEQFVGGFDKIKSVGMAFGEALVAIGAVIAGACGGWVAAIAAGLAHIVANIVIAIKEARDNGLAWGEALLEGLKNGIWNATAGLLKGIGELCTKVIDWFKALFGIHSPSTVMAEMGGFLVEGLFKGISISEFWNSIQSWFSNKLGDMKQWCLDTWDSIKTTASDKWNAIKTTVSDLADRMRSKVGEILDNLFHKSEEQTDDGLSLMNTSWGEKLSNIASNASSWATTMAGNVGSAITTMAENIGSGLSTAFDNFRNFFKQSGDGIGTWAEGMADWAYNGIKSVAQNIGNGVSAAVSNLNQLVTAYKNAKSETYSSFMNRSTTKSLLAAGKSVASAAAKFVASVVGSIKLPSLSSFLPHLAGGGILSNPTMALLGEYPGARNNPEIATPQSLLRETIDEANDGVIDAIYQMARQIVNAVEEVDMEVKIGDDTIAQSASRGDKAYKRRTGKSLFAY